MKRALKWVGYVVGFVVALLVVAVGVVYAVSSSKFGKSYPTAVESIAIPTDSMSLARGKHLVEAVGKCQGCHGDNYAGTKVLDDPVFGQLTSANLTSGQGGIVAPAATIFWFDSAQYFGRAAASETSSIVMGLTRGATPSARAVSSATSYHVPYPEFTQ